MATIWRRGRHQFCVRVRLKGLSETRTFDTRREAEEWARLVEGKITGEEFVEQGKARDTTLSQALDWYKMVVVPRTPRSEKVKLSQVTYWKGSKFASWSILSIRPW